MGNCLVKHKSDMDDDIDDDDSDNNTNTNHQFTGAGTGGVHLVTTKETWDQMLAQAHTHGNIVVANFSATWCGPCRMIAPFYVQLSHKHPSLMFLTVDVDHLTEFSSSWDIEATPTFLFLKDGTLIDKLVGANKPQLHNKLAAIFDQQPSHPPHTTTTTTTTT